MIDATVRAENMLSAFLGFSAILREGITQMFFSMDLPGRLLMKTVKILSETARRLVNGSGNT